MQNMRVGLISISFILCAFLWYEIFYFHQDHHPSPLLNKPVPRFQIIDLLGNHTLFTEKKLKGQVSLLNIWATWCYACQLEHDMLMKINKVYRVPIYSIVYKDEPHRAIAWLKEKGNPYKMVGLDPDGEVAIDLGLYGTPETFVIDKEGKIAYKHIGVIDQYAWDKVIYPIIKRLRL